MTRKIKRTGEKIKVKAYCALCNYEFTALVGEAGEGHKLVRSHIICPKCKNFLKRD